LIECHQRALSSQELTLRSENGKIKLHAHAKAIGLCFVQLLPDARAHTGDREYHAKSFCIRIQQNQTLLLM
jgi:hypothetical protein